MHFENVRSNPGNLGSKLCRVFLSKRTHRKYSTHAHWLKVIFQKIGVFLSDKNSWL